MVLMNAVHGQKIIKLSLIDNRFSIKVLYLHFAITKESDEVISPATILSLKLYKSYTKRMLIEQQTSGSDCEWPEFLLHTIPGLRKSARIATNNILK